MVAATRGSAQVGLHPIYLEVSLDSTFITYDMNATVIHSDTVRGSIISSGFAGAVTVALKTAMQWIVSTNIKGDVVQDGAVIGINQGETIPIEIIVTPSAKGPDTESYCLSLIAGSTTQAAQCLTLAITNAKSAVSTGLPIPSVTIQPNPAGTYILARGLNEELAGCRYEIFTISGAEVRHGTLPADARINVQDLNSGTYRLLLSDAKRTLTNTAFTVLH